MTKEEKFAHGEMTMRLSWSGGWQWCLYPTVDGRCYELLPPGTALKVEDDNRTLTICARHAEKHALQKKFLGALSPRLPTH
jgi:hypothetical protein